MPKPLNHGFQPLTNLDDRQNQIEVFNPGASGLQMVEASVPNDQLTNSFTIGGSLAVGGTGKLILKAFPGNTRRTRHDPS